MTPPAFRRSGERRAGDGGFGDGGTVAGSPFSRAQILHLMKTEFARARRYGFAVAAILAQVDRLQALADMHGSELRDVVRGEVGRLVNQTTRGADHLGLISDDRHLLVLPHTDGDAAMAVAERIRTAFLDLEVRVGQQPLSLTLSLGVASCSDESTLFFDTMLSQAEVALDWAIGAGGNQAIQFERSRFLDPRHESPAAGEESESHEDPAR